MDILLAMVTLIVTSVLGVIIYKRDKSSAPAQAFLVICLAIDVWILTNFITNHNYGYPVDINSLANRIAFFAGLSTVAAGVWFTYVFPRKRKVSTMEKLGAMSTALIGLILSLTNLVAGEVTLDKNGIPQFEAGPLLWLYLVIFLGLLALLSKNLILSIREEKGAKRDQSILILIAFCVSALLGLLFNAILPLVAATWETTRLGPVVTVVLVSIVAYSIIRHGLFDIKLAVVRSVAYVFSLVTLAAIYYLLAYVASVLLFSGEPAMGVDASPVNILLALALAFAFQPVRQFFDKFTDGIFYRDRYDSEAFYSRLSEIFTSESDLRGLLKHIALEVESTFRADKVSLYAQWGHHRVVEGVGNHISPSPSDIERLNERTLITGGRIIVSSALAERNELHRLLARHGISVVVPVMHKHTILGYLFLGYRQSGGYTNRDIKVLETVSNELVIAIQNALSTQEIKEFNKLLQQRVEAATSELRASNEKLRQLDAAKDEFVSMASHQLRTPLTSVKGYISMVLEGDAGKITPTQRRLLGEAFTSSERMVHLISDFLNVSRLQTGKFVIDAAEVSLADLVSEEVSALKATAETRSLKLKFRKPSHFPVLYLDEGKLRQVVMNFIDNAIFYSVDHSVITITLKIEDGDAVLEINDTGIGVPVEEQEHLFTKFFRAENARRQRPDGTGIGLFLAKKVITAHGGSMVFASVEGQGSTFGFRLPIKKLSQLPAAERSN